LIFFSINELYDWCAPGECPVELWTRSRWACSRSFICFHSCRDLL